MSSKNKDMEEDYNVPLTRLPLKFEDHNDMWIDMQLEYFTKYVDSLKPIFSLANGFSENLPYYQLEMERRNAMERIERDQENKENVIHIQ